MHKHLKYCKITATAWLKSDMNFENGSVPMLSDTETNWNRSLFCPGSAEHGTVALNVSC
jgi:hypothetical protein